MAPGTAPGYDSNLFPDSLPQMAVVGSRDSQRATDYLVASIDNSVKAVIPGGGHPAYLDDPGLWHRFLYNFMSALNC